MPSSVSHLLCLVTFLAKRRCRCWGWGSWSRCLRGVTCFPRPWTSANSSSTHGCSGLGRSFSLPFWRLTWWATGCATRWTPSSASESDMQPLLEVDKLNIAFETARSVVRPVRDVSLTIYPSQMVALVGESGCGKSVTAMSVLRLIPSPPGKVLGGRVMFDGRDLLSLSEAQMRGVRGKDIAMIFQEPMTSLNPVYTIGDQIVEAVMLHQRVGKSE